MAFEKTKLQYLLNDKPTLMKTSFLNHFIFVCLITLVGCNESSQKPVIKIDSLNSVSTESSFVEPTGEQKGHIQGSFGGCQYNKVPEISAIELTQPRPRELSQINSILKETGLVFNFKVYAAPIQNAAAVIFENKRIILYDPRLLSTSDLHSGSYWSSMSILAHEIGHHLLGHTLKGTGSNLPDELEADKYSGFMIYRLGGTLEEATAAMKEFGSETASETHPAKADRIEAIATGWNNANESRYQAAIPPPPADDESNESWEYTPAMLIDRENIQADSTGSVYGNLSYLYGIITDVDPDLTGMKVHIAKTSKEFTAELQNIDGKSWDVIIDNHSWVGNSVMDHASSMNFSSFFVPGRRMKFSMTEGFPGCGTSENGRWHITSAKALKGNSF